MTLLILAYIGGVLTILSPCILPVLPFVFSQSDQPFRKSGLPLLVGMALTFTLVSSLAVVGGTRVAAANQWGRAAALVLLTFFAFSLIFPHLLEKALQPILRLGNRLGSGRKTGSFTGSFWIGVSTGLLWAPCAGPILGLILTGAALQQEAGQSITLLLAYSLGAASSLAAALFAGGRFLGRMKKYLKAERQVKTVFGVLILLGVAAIALNLDRTLLTSLSRARTESLESALLGHFQPPTQEDSLVGQAMPELEGATLWLNSEPLTKASLAGRVVLIDFWTYSCINCLRTLPYVKAWAEKYQAAGLTVLGVHAPEFAFEKDEDNVRRAVRELGIAYPVALDNDFKIWGAFKNRFWPAHYFVDRGGVIRRAHFGEGDYEESELTIRRLLAGEDAPMAGPLAAINAQGVQAAGSEHEDSPETYVGYGRAENLLIDPVVKPNRREDYKRLTPARLNEWSLSGAWTVGAESATTAAAGARIAFRFKARDLHLVLGPAKENAQVRFKVLVDGQPLRDDHGLDTDGDGRGVLREHRLYQLIRTRAEGSIRERVFEIEFEDAGAQAYAFTFG